jgi:pantetheine-phosphate adenylyltransferase
MTKRNSHRIAVYTGVFDPLHLGHLDVIERGSRLFERLMVGVGINPEKKHYFSVDDRVAMVKQAVAGIRNVEVRAFDGLAVRFVREVGARVMLRGLRTLSDMEHEFSMSLTNLSLDPEIETVFLLTKDQYSHVSSTLIRQIGAFHGELDKFVPATIKGVLEKAFAVAPPPHADQEMDQ